MNKLKGQSEISCIMAIFMLLISVLLVTICTLWSDRTLDFWCTYFSHHVVDIPMWLSFLVTMLCNGVMFVFNIISEIARLCMGI